MNMKHIVTRSLSNKEKVGLKVKIHPLLLSAYEFINGLPKKFNKAELSQSLIADMTLSLPIFVCKDKRNMYIISGFDCIFFDLTNLDYKNRTVILVSNLTEDGIIHFCWSHILDKILFTLDTQRLAELYSIMKSKMPDYIAQLLVKKNCLSKKDFSDIFGISIDTLHKQYSKLNNKPYHKTASIFDMSKRLIEESRNEQ